LLILSALSCGLSLGTKPVLWVYGAAFAVAAAAAIVRRRKSVAAGLLLLLVGMAVPSAFWFGRAAATTGNPVYPLQLKLPGNVLLAGYSAGQITPPDYEAQFNPGSTVEWAVYPWVEFRRATGFLLIPYNAESGLGAAFAAFVPLGFLLGLARLFRRQASGLEAGLLLAILLLLIVWWFGLKRIPRFGLPTFLLMCALTAPLFARLQKAVPSASGWLLLLSVFATCGISSFVVVHDLVGQVLARNFSRHGYYSYPGLVDDLPRGSRIANWQCGYNNFALAGAHLTNRVIPDFEVPGALDTAWLRRNKVNYVIRNTPLEGAVPPGGMTLFYDKVLQDGENTSRRWQIWRFQDPPTN
jgi:hypothetical protein